MKLEILWSFGTLLFNEFFKYEWDSKQAAVAAIGADFQAVHLACVFYAFGKRVARFAGQLSVGQLGQAGLCSQRRAVGKGGLVARQVKVKRGTRRASCVGRTGSRARCASYGAQGRACSAGHPRRATRSCAHCGPRGCTCCTARSSTGRTRASYGWHWRACTRRTGANTR